MAGLKDALKTALPTKGDNGMRDLILYRTINAHPGAHKIHGRFHHKPVQPTAPNDSSRVAATIQTPGNDQATIGSGSEIIETTMSSTNVTV